MGEGRGGRRTRAPSRLLRAILPCAVLGFLALPGAAGETGLDARAVGSLEAGGAGVAAAVVDGDTLVLADGTVVRLVGIQAPKLPLGRPHVSIQPLAGEAKEALEELVRGRRLRLAYGGRRMDRHGRRLAHLFDEEGRWVQGEMVARGLARVYSFADNRALAPELLSLERAARAEGLGMWRHPDFRVLAPEETGAHVDSFQVVEGTVVDAAVVRGRAYLNFGADWRTDFTVTVAPRERRGFERAGIDLRAWKGKRVRVRGWIESFNGPMIEATHPEQIEAVGEE